MTQGVLRFDDHLPVPVFVRNPRARRYIIRVRSGGVRVTIPRSGSRREAEAFAASQRDWVAQQLARVAPKPANDVDFACAGEERVRTLWKRAKDELPSRLHELAALHGLCATRVSVRNQQWRWGSCSPSGHICLNWRLIVMPDWVRDYVLIHELMHLKRLDHSPSFWRLVARACPTYAEARAWLRVAGERPNLDQAQCVSGDQTGVRSSRTRSSGGRRLLRRSHP